jgi:hypothetical protein
MPQPPTRYTSRIQKGGALLEEMRQLVLLWSDAPVAENRAEIIRSNPLNKATRARIADVLNRVFIPRFVEGPIPNAWKLLRPLEELGPSLSTVRPIYFWLTALAEPLMADLCTEFLCARRANGLLSIKTEEAVVWVESKKLGWADVVNTKVTRAMLAALRDFGVLEWKAHKRLANQSLSPQSFAWLAFCFHLNGRTGRKLLEHPDWRLFAMNPADVEHLFFECHQMKMLEYHAAGSTIVLEFPASTPEEYAHVVARREA